MDYSRNSHANMLAMIKGLFDFSHGVAFDVFACNSRVASTVSYGAVRHCLEELSEQESKLIIERARDVRRGGVVVMDNVQNYLIQRDMRIGRTHAMNIGLAATYVEVEGIHPNALDLTDKMARLATSNRANLTVTQLLGYLDQKHDDTVLSLHWLLALINYIPCLSHLRKDVLDAFRTRAAKLRLPVQPSSVHPLATSSKNETVTKDLRDALFDFMEQIGQTPEDYQQRLILAGGDGMTFEKIMQVKKYLQFHSDNYQSLRLLEPVLAIWHTLWTDVSRIFESHWGKSNLSSDPSTLAHSAAKIGRVAPPNLKKVDYYPYSELAYLILDIRMLDCWR